MTKARPQNWMDPKNWMDDEIAEGQLPDKQLSSLALPQLLEKIEKVRRYCQILLGLAVA